MATAWEAGAAADAHLRRLRLPQCLPEYLLLGSLTFIYAQVSVIRLSPVDFTELIAYSARFMLDFDDAYQYAVAERHDLVIVSFDSDFDRTERGRRTPMQITTTGRPAGE